MKSSKIVKLDKSRARKIAGLIDNLRFAHPDNFSLKKNSKEDGLFFLFILVGICHQINWNFLINALNKVRLKTPSKFTPQYLSKITHQEITSWLSVYPRKERLDKKMKRAELVRDMARFLLKQYGGEILNLIRQAAGRMGGKNGLYDLLAEARAFGEDPLRKKAAVFIDLAEGLNLVKFSDWKNYRPPVDYHIARIILRSGVVKILDKKLLLKLESSKPVTKGEDLAIRRACLEAIILMANKEGKKTRKIQGILWALGRDCCHEKRPNCEDCRWLNCSCQKYLEIDCPGDCFLKEFCFAFNENKNFLKLREQNFISTWY